MKIFFLIKYQQSVIILFDLNLYINVTYFINKKKMKP